VARGADGAQSPAAEPPARIATKTEAALVAQVSLRAMAMVGRDAGACAVVWGPGARYEAIAKLMEPWSGSSPAGPRVKTGRCA
jgi:hypothetical protein